MVRFIYLRQVILTKQTCVPISGEGTNNLPRFDQPAYSERQNGQACLHTSSLLEAREAGPATGTP
jgi:hypothetical protein